LKYRSKRGQYLAPFDSVYPQFTARLLLWTFRLSSDFLFDMLLMLYALTWYMSVKNVYSFRKQGSHILCLLPIRGLWSLHYPGTYHICLIWVFGAYMGVFDCFTYIINNDLVSFLPFPHVPARSFISIEPCDCIALPYTTRLKEIFTV